MNKPTPPVFPKDWYQHCPNVLEAKHWHEKLKLEEKFTNQDLEEYAECDFRDAGIGKECENCGIFLTRPFLNHDLDKEFLPKIERYYREMEKYFEDLAVWEKEQKENQSNSKPQIEPSLTYDEANLVIEILDSYAKKNPKKKDQVRIVITKIQLETNYLKQSKVV